jgi:hypothetical protein
MFFCSFHKEYIFTFVYIFLLLIINENSDFWDLMFHAAGRQVPPFENTLLMNMFIRHLYKSSLMALVTWRPTQSADNLTILFCGQSGNLLLICFCFFKLMCMLSETEAHHDHTEHCLFSIPFYLVLTIQWTSAYPWQCRWAVAWIITYNGESKNL